MLLRNCSNLAEISLAYIKTLKKEMMRENFK